MIKNPIMKAKSARGTEKTLAAFTKEELSTLRKINTPRKVQDFLDSNIRYNIEAKGETLSSPRVVLKRKTAHCIEGAFLAAAALRLAGYEPLVMDFQAVRDKDHVVCIFKENGLWGAVSSSRYHTLRYRDPVYKTVRELALSYFPFYNNDDGELTLRNYSTPINLSRFDKYNWMTSEDDLWDVGAAIDESLHKQLVSKTTAKKLRKLSQSFVKADWIEK